MPDSSSGVYTRPSSPTPVTGQGADAPQVNVPLDDIAAALNRRSFRDGRVAMTGNQNYNGYRVTGAGDAVDSQDYVTLAQVQALIASISAVPAGLEAYWTGTTAPAGWLIETGQTLSRSTYAALWAHAQTSGMLAASEGAKTPGQFGPGDGSSTFTLPNPTADGGYFLRPITGGRTIGSTQADDFKSHDHDAAFVGDVVPPHVHNTDGPSGGGNTFGGGNTGVGQTTWQTESAGGFTPTGDVTVSARGGTETRPKNIGRHVIIKT